MKRKFFYIMMLLCTASVAMSQSLVKPFAEGNVDTFVERVTAFVDSTAVHCSSYSKEDWSISFDELKKINDSYRLYEEQLTKEQKEDYCVLYGRYIGMAAKIGASNVVEGAITLVKKARPFLEGFWNSLKKTDTMQVQPSGTIII